MSITACFFSPRPVPTSTASRGSRSGTQDGVCGSRRAAWPSVTGFGRVHLSGSTSNTSGVAFSTSCEQQRRIGGRRTNGRSADHPRRPDVARVRRSDQIRRPECFRGRTAHCRGRHDGRGSSSKRNAGSALASSGFADPLSGPRNHVNYQLAVGPEMPARRRAPRANLASRRARTASDYSTTRSAKLCPPSLQQLRRSHPRPPAGRDLRPWPIHVGRCLSRRDSSFTRNVGGVRGASAGAGAASYRSSAPVRRIGSARRARGCRRRCVRARSTGQSPSSRIFSSRARVSGLLPIPAGH